VLSGMPAIFKSRIEYLRPGCAFLGSQITVQNPGYVLSNSTTYPPQPIDSVGVSSLPTVPPSSEAMCQMALCVGAPALGGTSCGTRLKTETEDE
jgi:hypothetical protein